MSHLTAATTCQPIVCATCGITVGRDDDAHVPHEPGCGMDVHGWCVCPSVCPDCCTTCNPTVRPAGTKGNRMTVPDVPSDPVAHPDPPVCGDRGPRIGNEGAMVCVLPAGHEGEHRGDPSWRQHGWPNDRPVFRHPDLADRTLDNVPQTDDQLRPVAHPDNRWTVDEFGNPVWRPNPQDPGTATAWVEGSDCRAAELDLVQLIRGAAAPDGPSTDLRAENTRLREAITTAADQVEALLGRGTTVARRLRAALDGTTDGPSTTPPPSDILGYARERSRRALLGQTDTGPTRPCQTCRDHDGHAIHHPVTEDGDR